MQLRIFNQASSAIGETLNILRPTHHDDYRERIIEAIEGILTVRDNGGDYARLVSLTLYEGHFGRVEGEDWLFAANGVQARFSPTEDGWDVLVEGASYRQALAILTLNMHLDCFYAEAVAELDGESYPYFQAISVVAAWVNQEIQDRRNGR